MRDNTSRMSCLLKQVRLLKDKYQELAAVTGEDFNVFSILGVQTDEVRTHSAFLSELLNPQGSHRQGTVFLKLFLELCLKGTDTGSRAFDNKKLDDFRVGAEVSVDQGRIDVLLEKDDACIVIENKIYAEDQPGQLNRYHRYACGKNIGHDQIKLVYLTLDGSKPSEDSLRDENGRLGKLKPKDVLCISYKEHITRWLEACMRTEEVQRISPIREILFQYRNLLYKLTGQPTNRRFTMELTKILEENENYELINGLEKSICEFKVQLQFKFWKELEKQMTAREDVKKYDNQEYEASKDAVRKYYTPNTSGRKWFGLTFDISAKLPETSPEIGLRVELEDGIYYGFVPLENRKRVGKCREERFDDLVDRLELGDEFKRGDWWLGWKYPQRNLSFPFTDIKSEDMRRLLEDSERYSLVEALANELVDEIEKVGKNLNKR